jgi:hypothetical protein
MGQLESLRELNITESKKKKNNKRKKEKYNKSMPMLFILMGNSVKLEMLRHCILKLFGSFIVLC